MAVIRDKNGKVKKGSVLNPKGRPRKGTALTDLLRAIGEEKNADGVKNKTLLARKLWEMAIEGNERAAKIIYDRCEGRPLQSVNVKGDGEITVKYVNDWRGT